MDLFSGIGGISLALQEWVRPIAYCEIERYAQGVLLSRMSEGELPRAPIWDDVRTLDGKKLRGLVDIIYGGFPCQDISVAGRGKGLAGERSGLFFEIVRLAEEIKPTFIYLENVPAIRTRGLETVIRELSDQGYDCRWCDLSAAEVGAPHKRNRWWLLGYSEHYGSLAIEEQRSLNPAISYNTQGTDKTSESERTGSSRMLAGEFIPYADGTRCQEQRREVSAQQEQQAVKCGSEWTIEPSVGRVANGVSNRVDRIRSLGNAVVPLQAKVAFEYLLKDAMRW